MVIVFRQNSKHSLNMLECSTSVNPHNNPLRLGSLAHISEGETCCKWHQVDHSFFDSQDKRTMISQTEKSSSSHQERPCFFSFSPLNEKRSVVPSGTILLVCSIIFPPCWPFSSEAMCSRLPGKRNRNKAHFREPTPSALSLFPLPTTQLLERNSPGSLSPSILFTPQSTALCPIPAPRL